MTYLPTDEDLALLKNHSSHVFCRIDLLNKNFVTIDSLEGVAIDGSISVDSTSDVRRTFNVTMYLGKNSNIANVTEEEWLARNIRVFIGLAGRTKAKISTKSAAILAEEDIRWYNQGCFSFSSNGFTYNATTNTVQASCVDMVSRLNGDLAGQLAGNAHRIDKKADVNKSIEAVMKESEFSKYCIDYWSRKVPHDLDYDTGTTTWQILTELRDLYYPFEMYFDDDIFVCREIPSGFNDPPVLEPELFASLVTSDGESATVDYTSVRNCIEVFGATIDADVFSDANNTTYSIDSNTLALKVSAASGSYQMNADGSNFSITSDTKISFRAPVNFTGKQLNFMVTFTAIYVNDKKEQEPKTTSKTSILYAAVANADGQDKAQDPSVMVAGKYYVVQ